MGLNDRAGTGVRLTGAVSDALFCLLLALNVARTLHHAMWRDELQVFQLGAHSRTLLDLLGNLRYEPHGVLWAVLVWAVAQVTANPVWMQVLHAAVATGIWVLVYRWSPFTRLEKFLLLLSYFLFFEYFVVSRHYALAVLCGFGLAVLRQYRPERVLAAWLLLGLLANLFVYATIWSIALAAIFVLEVRRRDAAFDRAFLGGAAAYIALLAFGIASLMPAPDFGPWGARPAIATSSLSNALPTVLGAFIPLDPGWLQSAVTLLIGGHGGPVPFVWDPNPAHQVLALTGAAHPLWLAALLAAPVGLCALLTRDRLRVLEFTLAYLGIMLFAVLWHFTGNARHHGIVFAVFMASVWAARARAPRAASSCLLVAVLAVNAFGGLITLGSEFSVFSHSRNAARWIEGNAARLPLIGSRDAQVSSVAGYLGRPVYYLECECMGTFIVWNAGRQSPLETGQVRDRLSRALERQGGPAILILNRPLAPEELPDGVTGGLLHSFTGAVTDENYWIYRLARAGP